MAIYIILVHIHVFADLVLEDNCIGTILKIFQKMKINRLRVWRFFEVLRIYWDCSNKQKKDTQQIQELTQFSIIKILVSFSLRRFV